LDFTAKQISSRDTFVYPVVRCFCPVNFYFGLVSEASSGSSEEAGHAERPIYVQFALVLLWRADHLRKLNEHFGCVGYWPRVWVCLCMFTGHVQMS